MALIEVKKLSNIRKVIARAMYESLQNSAQLTHHLSADVRKLQAFRKMVMASERGIRSARLVISVETSSAERDDHADEYERLRLAYGRDFRVLEIRGEDENRKKLSRVFSRIRQILTDAGERAAR